MSNTIYIKKDRLLELANNTNAIELLYDYFNEFEIEYFSFDDYIQIKLTASQYTYCEDISNGLKFLGIEKEDVKDFCIIQDRAALCLSENWLPFAFATFLSREDKDLPKLTILHVDDHRDLMSPYLRYHDGCYFDMISGNVVEFTDCLSIKNAIKSGAITIGSMLTPIVYSRDQVDIFHIKENVRNELYGLKKICYSDNLLWDDCQRIGIQIDKIDYSVGKYYITSEWSNMLKHVDISKPCLLHIDMDYFNNRYNASTSWADIPNRHDPSFPEQKILMNKLFDGVKKVQELTEIRYVLIGISPSFYPVEYWNDGLRYLIGGLEALGLPVANLLSSCTAVKSPLSSISRSS